MVNVSTAYTYDAISPLMSSQKLELNSFRLDRKKKVAQVLCTYECTRMINRQLKLLKVCVHGNVSNQNKNDLDPEKILILVRKNNPIEVQN